MFILLNWPCKNKVSEIDPRIKFGIYNFRDTVKTMQ